MNKISGLLAITALMLLSASGAAAQQAGNTFFQTLAGRWTGTLEYSDYQTEKRVTLKTSLEITPAADGATATFAFLYDDFGKVLKSSDTHRIDSAAHKYLMDGDEFALEEKPGRLMLSGRQLDNNRLEPVRITVTYTPDTLVILKETRDPFRFRHQYTFRRAAAQPAPEKVIAPTELAEDFAAFRRTLTTLHPGIYRYNSPAEVEKLFDAAAAQLDRPRGEGEFFALLAQTAARLRCGHTYLNPLNQTKDLRARLFERATYFPFYFRLIDRRLIVTGNVSSKTLPPGSEITRINGVPSAEIVDRLLAVASVDGNNTLAHKLKNLELQIAPGNTYQLFDIYFPLLFPLRDESYAIEAVDYRTKQPTNFQVLAMTRAERSAVTEARYGATPTYDDEWQFGIRPDGIGYLKIGNSLTWRLKTVKFKEFLAATFAELRQAKVKKLIIDLRGNGGGDTDVGFELARYLARKRLPPYLAARRLVRNVAAHPELLKHLDTYSDELKATLRDGWAKNSYRPTTDGFFEILPNENVATYPAVEPYVNNFTGKTWIISDASNASATFQFLNYAQTNRLATIAGQPTGGNKQGINGGNYFFLYLPHSRIEIDLPVYYSAPLTPQQDASVIPDRLLAPRIDAIADGTDAELKQILGWLKK